VASLLGKTQEDPEGRLAKRLDPIRIAPRDDVSHGDILGKPHDRVNPVRYSRLTSRAGLSSRKPTNLVCGESNPQSAD
jgi:hypothetical protein